MRRPGADADGARKVALGHFRILIEEAQDTKAGVVSRLKPLGGHASAATATA